ncbi:MAG: hypothetical protein KDC95_09565 [Planctomycetes bacterium]|nr:hypothetical protein [Planctomycetota bacterium]
MSLGLPPGVGTLTSVLSKTGATVLTAFAANLATNIVEEGRGAKINSDIDRASGEAIAAIVEKMAKSKQAVGKKRGMLLALAKAVRKAHDPKQLTKASAVAALPLDASAILSDPKGYIDEVSLDASEWERYLSELAECNRGIQRLGIGSNIRKIADELEQGYTGELYAQLRLSINGDGKAFAGAVLRQLDTILKNFGSMQQKLLAESARTTGVVEELLRQVQAIRDEFDFAAAQVTLENLANRFASLEGEIASLLASMRLLPSQLQLALDRMERFVQRIEGAARTIARPRLDTSLRLRLNVQRDSCLAKQVGFYTPHVLKALLSVRDGIVERLIEQVSSGATAQLRRALEGWSERQAKDEAASLQAAAWESREDVQAAVDLAANAGAQIVLDQHLLLAVLRGNSRTVKDLKSCLVDGALDRLVAILENPNPTQPGATPDGL